MGEEMVGICAKQSVMRVDLIEVTYLAVDFGIAIILMSIYGFGDAVAHGWIEFPVLQSYSTNIRERHRRFLSDPIVHNQLE